MKQQLIEPIAVGVSESAESIRAKAGPRALTVFTRSPPSGSGPMAIASPARVVKAREVRLK